MVKASVKVEKTKGPPIGYGDLGGVSVLVGIPQKNKARRGGGIDNASLLFIFSNGSPLRGIPARPVLEPAIEANQKPINAELEKATAAALANDPPAVMQAMKRAGMVASNAAKQWFFDSRNGWAPNKPSTIAGKGSSQPGIDTGQMRRAITYVVVGQFRKRPGVEGKDEEYEKMMKKFDDNAGNQRLKAQSEGAEEGAGLVEEAAEVAGEAGELLAEGGEILLL